MRRAALSGRRTGRIDFDPGREAILPFRQLAILKFLNHKYQGVS